MHRKENKMPTTRGKNTAIRYHRLITAARERIEGINCYREIAEELSRIDSTDPRILPDLESQRQRWLQIAADLRKVVDMAKGLPKVIRKKS